MSYCTIDDLILRYGSANLTMWSAMDGNNSDSLIPQRQQQACDWAENQINSLLTRSGYTIPLVFLDSYAQGMVNQWAVDLAVWKLYQARGHSDEDKSSGKFEEARSKVIAEIMKVRAGSLQFNCARRWGDNPTSPTVV